ncbi:MAG: hypothetical protein EBZ13_13650, partial [Planctomycetia bacterium]|nr:hypothetical protein [Planctomycetia bacterium]
MRLPSWPVRSPPEWVFGRRCASVLGVRLMRTYDPRLVSGEMLSQLICLLRRSPLMYLAESGIFIKYNFPALLKHKAKSQIRYHKQF